MPYKPVDQAIKVILGPCIDDIDFKAREEALTYDQAGIEIDVILEKHDGTVVTTAVVPTAAGDYDWAHTDQGYYELELPASGGVSFNNSEEGSIRVVGYCTGVLPFSSVVYDIVPEKVWNSLVEGSDNLEVDLTQIGGVAQSATDLKDFADAGYDPATNKVEGVKLADTSTAVTNDVGITQAGADKVWGTAARTLTSFGTLIADIWSYVTRALTDKAGFSLAADQSGVTTGTVNALGAQAKLDVNAECDTALSDYGANTTVPDAAGTAAGLHATTDGKIDTNKTELDGLQGADGKCVISADAQDLSATLDVNAKTLESTLDLTATMKTSVNAEADTALADYDPPTRTEATADKDAIIVEVDANETKIDLLQTDSTAIKGKTDALPSGIAKNVALPSFDFYMLLADGLTAATGKTVTGQIRKDNGSFAAITNAISEVGSGLYAIASGFTQAEMNADKITLKFTADACKDTIVVIYPT